MTTRRIDSTYRMSKETISMSAIRALVSGLAKAGQPVDEILAASGVVAGSLHEPHARVSDEVFVNLIKRILIRTGDEALCLLPRPMKAGAFSMACHISIHCRDLREALHRIAAFYNLIDCGLRFEIRSDEREVSFRVTQDSSEQISNSVILEVLLLAFHRFFSWLVGQPLMLSRVCLSQINAEYGRAYGYHFLEVPILVDPAVNSLTFSSSYLDLPITRSEADRSEFLRRQAIRLLEPMKRGGELSVRVRARIAAHLEEFGSVPTLDDLESALGVSSRTIAEQLKCEGMRFRDFLSLVRRDIAVKYMLSSALSLEEIAYKTGYSEPSAFSRAYKNWTGLAPKDHRKSATQRLDGDRNPAGRLGSGLSTSSGFRH